MKVFVVTLLIVVLVSCAPANQPEPLSTTPSTSTPPAVSTRPPSPTATTQFIPTLELVQTPPVPSDEPILVYFVSEQGKFNVWMPVSGIITEYTFTRMFFGKSVECSSTASSLNSAGVTVQYCDLDSEDIASLSDSAILEEVHNTVKSELRLRVDKEQAGVTDGSYPTLTLSGVENMRGDVYDGTFKARIILVENRVYFVHMSVYHINWCNCLHQMDQVVDSFYVEPEMSIPFEPTP